MEASVLREEENSETRLQVDEVLEEILDEEEDQLHAGEHGLEEMLSEATGLGTH